MFFSQHDVSGQAQGGVCDPNWLLSLTYMLCGVSCTCCFQVGWATIHCPFTAEEGVGDAPDSYAVDGKRLRSVVYMGSSGICVYLGLLQPHQTACQFAAVKSVGVI